MKGGIVSYLTYLCVSKRVKTKLYSLHLVLLQEHHPSDASVLFVDFFCLACFTITRELLCQSQTEKVNCGTEYCYGLKVKHKQILFLYIGDIYSYSRNDDISCLIFLSVTDYPSTEQLAQLCYFYCWIS